VTTEFTSTPIATASAGRAGARPAWSGSAWAHTDVDLLIVTSMHGVCLDVSDNCLAMLGVDVDELIGHTVCDVASAADLPTLRALRGQLDRDGRARSTVRLHHRDGRVVWLDVVGQPATDDGRFSQASILFVARDVTDDVQAFEHLAESEQRWRLAFEHSPLGAALVSPAGEITLANAALGQMLGHRPTALAMMSLADITHGDDRMIDAAKFSRLIGGDEQTYTVEKRFVGADGRRLWGQLTAAAVPDLHGEVRGVIVQVQDVTQRRDAELELANRALHDPLTGLANRFLVQQWLTGALQENVGCGVGVLYCDLDRFKLVNDTLGHGAGDDVIAEAAARLRAAVRPDDLVGRVGGDEFVIVCERLDSEDELLDLALRVGASLDQPIVIHGHSHIVTISIGAATGLAPETAEQVLMRADIALLRAKRLGRARVEVFDPAIDRVATRDDLLLEDDLRLSVDSGQLQAFYQPIVVLSDRTVVGHEALLRWKHPQRGLISPEGFLDIAETSGLIRSLGWWVLDQACRDHVNGLGGPDGAKTWVAVNASPVQLTRADVYRVVRETLDRTGMRPEHLHIEITETALIQASRALVRELKMLRELGVGIALDDFGTGYSSLSLLRDFPVSTVKIDKSFITPLLKDRGALSIVRAVIGMCRDMDVPVVAEGVETEEQAKRLNDLGCSHAQGYLFGRPRQRLQRTAGDRRASTGRERGRVRRAP
jgi:diguanylate cyclase (GGDEF)-like protein/PAS domain S-box-containing protein